MKRHTVNAIVLLALLLLPAAALAQNVTEPNDPQFSDEWSLNLIGATCAWQHTTGSPDVTVAVVDSGVDMKHPDLVGRLRTDGYDFVAGDDDPSDENGHGTNVTGIIAATLNNGEGIVGAAPGVMILPVRVMNAKGYGSDRSIARGVRYAADKGAKVINLSLGATLTISADTESQQVSEAIRYAQSKGALIVVAAGNDFVPLPNAIVGDNPDVLIVAATDEDDRKADFSNSGPWISVTAPGVHILSTMPTYEVYLTSNAVPPDERFQQNYDYMSGTSQATPFVSALGGLLFSEHPDWDASQVSQEIKNYAADITKRNPQLTAKGWLGSGRIDACQSLGGPIEPVVPSAQPTGPLSPNVVPRSNDALIIAGVLACGVILLLALLLFALVRAGRRRRAPAAPAPASAVSPGTMPVAPVQLPATAPPPGAWGMLNVVGGASQARSYPLVGAEILIGRGDDCAVLLLGDATVSRRHALVRNNGGMVTVEDAGSTHGTLLRGQPLGAPAPVQRGDVVQVGQTLLRFE
jgi:type VII secretion-associated serine protease mycosin